MVLVSGLAPDRAQAANGDFSGDFAAAASPTYNHATGGGAYNDDTSDNDTVEQLNGGDFACGDIVTFLQHIVVDDTQSAADDAPQTIEIDYQFDAETNNNRAIGYTKVERVSINYGQVENGDNYSGVSPGAGVTGLDGGIDDDRQGPTLGLGGIPEDTGSGGSTATIIFSQDGILGTNTATLVTVEVNDLNQNEQVVLRIDVKLSCTPGVGSNSGVPAALSEARLTKIQDNVILDPPQAIPGNGTQTINLNLSTSDPITPTDWGDAPDSYGTLLLGGNGAPRHGQDPALGIGTVWDSENDGIPTEFADGDDNDTLVSEDDEDGITDPEIRVGDTSVTLPVEARNASQTLATLRCWIDFDKNGTFDEAPVSATVPANSASIFNLVFTTDQTFSPGDKIFIRCRIAYVDAQITDPTGDAATGEVEDMMVTVSQTVAVTIGYFLAQRDGDVVNFTWQTATETGNAGFNLFAETDGGLVQLNDALIASTVIDSVEPTDYAYTAATSATSFYIEDVSITGATDRLGPFAVGTSVGFHMGAGVESSPAIWLPMISN